MDRGDMAGDSSSRGYDTIRNFGICFLSDFSSTRAIHGRRCSTVPIKIGEDHGRKEESTTKRQWRRARKEAKTQSMITALLALIFIASVIQPNRQRLFAGLVYSGLLVANDLILFEKEGFAYYGGSALFDLAAIIVISCTVKVSSMALTIQKICLASICLNFFGWVMWMLYMPPVMYNSLFIALYVCALLTLITRNKSDVGEYKLDSRSSRFRPNYNPGILGCIKHDHPAQP